MSEQKENKSVISIALLDSAKEIRNEEKSLYFVTKKDTEYIVNNLPMLMKCYEKKCKAFLDIVKAKNDNKSLTANQISKVMIALLNHAKVLEVMKNI